MHTESFLDSRHRSWSVCLVKPLRYIPTDEREAGCRTIRRGSSARSGIQLLRRCDVYIGLNSQQSAVASWSLLGLWSLPETFPVYALCAHGAGPKAECTARNRSETTLLKLGVPLLPSLPLSLSPTPLSSQDPKGPNP